MGKEQLQLLSSQQKPDTVMKSITSTPCHAPIIESQKGDCIGHGEYIIQGPWFPHDWQGKHGLLSNLCGTAAVKLKERRQQIIIEYISMDQQAAKSQGKNKC
jgi:hypothetical protein